MRAMKWTMGFAAILAAVSLCAGPRAWGGPGTGAAPADSALAALAEGAGGEVMAAFRYFVGVWEPVKEAGAAVPKVSETYTFAPILDGAFLMSQEIYKDASGKVVYRDFAVFGVDPDTQKLFLHAYN